MILLTVQPDAYIEPVVPVLDDLLVRFRGRWVAVTDRQAPVIRHLLDNLDSMVSVDDLRPVYVDAGGSGDPAAMRSLMYRVGVRLTEVGASVTFARRRTAMTVSVPPVCGWSVLS